MIRGVRRALPVTFVLLAITSVQARAQFFDNAYYPYGYGEFGWGGWSGTVQGDMARGLGQFAAGAGARNEQNALANAVNGDTVSRWNDYMFSSQSEADQQHYKRLSVKQQQRERKSAEMIYRRLSENPTEEDIASGDALNVALHQISDPRFHRTALQLATAPLTGDLIDDIPFISATDAISLSLNQLSAKDSWPAGLRGDAFAAEREAYQQAIAKALDEDKDGEISPRTLEALRRATSQLRVRLRTSPPDDDAEYAEAENYVKTLIGLARMLQKPKFEKVIAELEKIKKTSMANLLGFMHTFNLRFGRATSDRQREVYSQLYPTLAELRDRVLKEAAAKSNPRPKASASASSTKTRPTDFFRGMHLDHLEGKAADQGVPAKPE